MIQKRIQKPGLLGLALAMAMLLPGCLCYLTPGNVVFFPDQALESAIRAELRKPFGCITESDLLQVRNLEAPELNIRDLRGLEHCTFIEKLDLRSNLVRNIDALTNLENLRTLNLGDNRIENIDALAGLSFLDFLALYGDENEISDFRPLVANVQAAGGLGAGSVLILGTNATLSDGEIAPGFQATYETLIDANIDVQFAESDGTRIEF